MRILLATIVIFAVHSSGIAQQTNKNLKKMGDKAVIKDVGKVESTADKAPKSDSNQTVAKTRQPYEIDYQQAPHAVIPKKVTNTLSGPNKVRKPFGYADTSGPEVKLAKKQDNTGLTTSELKERLGNPKSARSEVRLKEFNDEEM